MRLIERLLVVCWLFGLILMLDLLSIGGITFDNLFWVNRLPKTHFEGIIERQGRFFGGRAPNVAVATAKLGIKSGLVSSVGGDFESEGYENYLKNNGVDSRGVLKFHNEKTKQVFIFTDLKGNQITFFDYGAERHFSEMKTPIELIKESRFVHISSSGDYKFNIRCAKYAHNNDVAVSFDPGNDPFTEINEYLSAMLQNCNILFMNNLEARGILKRLKLNKANELLSFGPERIVVIDKNDKSSIVFSQHTTENIPSIIRGTKDPTGASDGYVSGFLSGHLKGYSNRICAQIGAVEASFVAEGFGAQTNLPTWQLMQHRFKQQFKDLL